MKKIIYLLIFVPCLMWGQDTYEPVISASGKNVNKKTQLAVNVVVDTVDFSGELQNKGVENLQDALNSIDAFILAASDPFNPDADLLSNDALWDFKRLNQDFFKLDPANNRIQAMGDFKIGGGSNTVLTGFRFGISSTSSAKGGLGITQTAGNTNPFIAWGNNSAGNDKGQINSDGSITSPYIDSGKLGGTTANRPATPKQYQDYFDTTLGYNVTWNGTNWVDGTGTVR